MQNWLLQLYTWLAVALGTACNLQDLPEYSAGWMATTQALHGLQQDPAPNRSQPTQLSLYQCPLLRHLTALFDSKECVTLSRYSVQSQCPRHRIYLKLTLADKPGHWPLRHKGTPRLPARWTQSERPLRRNSDWTSSRWTKDIALRCLYVQQTKVLVLQECSSSSTSPSDPPLSGAQQPARCWRFASAHSCASPTHHARTGVQTHDAHSQCATSLYHSSNPQKPPCMPQVLPQPPAVATCLARRHPGEFRSREGFCRTSSFWTVDRTSSFLASACEPAGATPPLLNSQMHTLSSPFARPASSGSREAVPPTLITTARRQVRVHSHHIHDATQSTYAITSPRPGCPLHELPLLRAQAVDTLQPRLAVDNPERYSATRARASGMGKRGKRTGRRRRPRDTARESKRPPKRSRCREVADATAVEEVDSSSSSSGRYCIQPRHKARARHSPATYCLFRAHHQWSQHEALGLWAKKLHYRGSRLYRRRPSHGEIPRGVFGNCSCLRPRLRGPSHVIRGPPCQLQLQL